MKISIKQSLLSAALLLAALATQAATHVDSLLNCLHNPKSNYVFVIAHRADWRGAPENSIQGIENAIRMGVDMVEIDIRRTADGQFILMHDATLNRTSTGILNTASRHDSQTKVNIANCVAVNKQVTLKDNYKDTMQTLYNANVESMDFASPKALAKINAWCSRQTEGMIPKIVDQLDPAATAVLMNAVYFNGTWANVFDKNDTKTENFRGYTRDIKKVPMMHQEGKFSYTDNKDFAAVTLPYGNGTYSMTVILPAEGKSTTEIVNSLNAKTLEKMRLDMDECVVDLKLPRFSTTTETSLNKPIATLGASSMFHAGKADFSNMSDVPMFVSAMLQKAKIEVSEKGTKAAAVTAAIMTMSVRPEEPRHVSFHANRPFIYLITERNSNAIFFIGQYTGAE